MGIDDLLIVLLMDCLPVHTIKIAIKIIFIDDFPQFLEDIDALARF